MVVQRLRNNEYLVVAPKETFLRLSFSTYRLTLLKYSTPYLVHSQLGPLGHNLATLNQDLYLPAIRRKL